MLLSTRSLVPVCMMFIVNMLMSVGYFLVLMGVMMQTFPFSLVCVGMKVVVNVLVPMFYLFMGMFMYVSRFHRCLLS